MRSCTLVACVLFASAALGAARPGRVTPLVREAERLYTAGRYREAAALLLKAQALEPNSRLVYNIARAFDQAGDLPKALQYYQQYSNSPGGTDPRLLKRAVLAMDRIRSVLAQEERLKSEAAEARARAAARPPEPPPDPELIRQRELAAARERAAVAAAERAHATGVLEAELFSGLSLLSLGSGVAFGLSAQRAKSHFMEANTVASKQVWQSATVERAALADASFAVALAAGVTALVVYPDKGRLPFFSLGPQGGPGLVGAWAEVRF